MNLIEQLATLARRGVLLPGRPDRVARQLASLHQWGYGLAGEARQAAARSPHRVAVIDEHRGAVTFAQLLEGSDRTAAVLRGMLGGTAAEDWHPGSVRVGVLCRNHLALLEVMIGASSLGLDVVLLNTGLSPSQAGAVARQHGLSLLVHDADLTETARGAGCPLVLEGELVARARSLTHADPGVSPPHRHGRTIVLTSGTTGTPRGARRPHPRGFSALASILDRIPVGVGGTVLLSAPIFHTWGLAGVQLCLALRSTMVLQRRFDPEAARGALRRNRCDAMIAVPVMLQRLVELPDADLSTAHPASGPEAGGARPGRLGGDRLRIVAVSGSRLPSGLAQRFMTDYGPVLYNLYGSTEVSWVSVATPAELAVDPDCAGRPPRGTRIAIVEGEAPTATDVPDGAVGRILVDNDLLFDGYSDGTRPPASGGMVPTGDLGRWVDGRLQVLGREDDLVVSGGENVYPRELESALAELPELREAAVFGVADREFGQRLVAYVVCRPGLSLTPEEVVERVRARVARHALPREVVVVDHLPRDATGKILVRELRETHPDQ
ncbi:AMP-binding protein [Intrasporangium sp. DVR]|uniref:AMP-binding protein n=1 Tax=Intrasporangium sp. DVR TaxID=3127867 RepID=UPI00313A733D